MSLAGGSDRSSGASSTRNSGAQYVRMLQHLNICGEVAHMQRSDSDPLRISV
jgi:hypothetical protein